MRAALTLRRWQAAALEAWQRASRPRTWLCTASPGAGKTTYALVWGGDVLANDVDRIGIVCPTAHLRKQWQRAAHRLGIELCSELPRGARLDRAYQGAVLTYHQVAADPGRIRRLLGGAAIIFDEIHHASHESVWGQALLEAFGDAPLLHGLSGTPFRSDGGRIPFVRYDEQGVSVSDYTYGYADALEDGAVRPIYFVSVGGSMAWERGGEKRTASFNHIVGRDLASERLRTALNPAGAWMEHTLTRAHARLVANRAASHPDAGGLVVCQDRAHARAVAARLQAISGAAPAIALSDDPGASRVISTFAESGDPWICAVGMISEGTDVPRLRVGVWATNICAELAFRQIVGRVVRVTPRPAAVQDAFFYLPADPTLLGHARSLAEERGHAAAPLDVAKNGEGEADALPRAEARESRDFRALTADPEEGVVVFGGTVVSPADLARARMLGTEWRLDGDPLELAVRIKHVLGAADGGGVPVEERRHVLRSLLARRVAEYARITGRAHQDVNRGLVRRAGKRVDDLDELGLARHVRYLEERIARREEWDGETGAGG